ncbi:energy-coupling factor ABC transporter permease [Litoribrevibacter euphylliae]|uniref:Energy-coupling factor ABC transporter permease n=1 Tax=Litoribrevibacter euphylliae TaxID=1834034 RepID=A0ABV7HLE5_9GAMM
MYLSVDLSFYINLILSVLISVQFLLAIRSIDWAAFLVFRHRQHLVLGALVITFGLWQLRGWFDENAAIYILGINLITLILGWAFSTLIVVINTVFLALVGVNDWAFWALNTFFWGCLPVIVSLLCYRLVVYWLENPFAYIYLCGFFAAVATLVLPALFLCLLFFILDLPESEIVLTYLEYAPVICIPEGVLNGMLLVSFVIFLPDWVKTYDELRYERNSKTRYK